MVNGVMVMSLRIIEWHDFAVNSAVSSANRTSEAAITIGVFDGVHLGHQTLIERVVRQGPNPTVITFRENPKKMVSPGLFEGDLYSLKQKLTIFESLGISRAILIDFSEDFSKLGGRDFLDILQNRGQMTFLAVGSSFRCGFRQDMNAELIREINEAKGIPTEIVPPVTLPKESEPVSSSRVRQAIISGCLKEAAALLGRSFIIDLSEIEGEFLRPCPRPCPKPAPGSDTRRGSYVYDLRSAYRVAPDRGEYSVLMQPGCVAGQAKMENGKVYLSGKAESIEFNTD